MFLCSVYNKGLETMTNQVSMNILWSPVLLREVDDSAISGANFERLPLTKDGII